MSRRSAAASAHGRDDEVPEPLGVDLHRDARVRRPAEAMLEVDDRGAAGEAALVPVASIRSRTAGVASA
jgi:hypothetical protein